MTIDSFREVLTADNASLPMYQRIKEHILDKIARGAWSPNQKLPSENEISAILGVSRMTVNRAFKELSEEGYLFREKGAGTFVAEPFQLTPFFELMPISQEVAIEGDDFSTEILKMEAVSLSLQTQILQDYFNVDSGESALFYSEMIYFSNGAPIQYEKRYVLVSFAGQYLKKTFKSACSTTYLQTLSPTLSQKHTLEAIIPDEDLCNILRLDSPEACFKVTEKLLIQKEVVSWAEQYYPASRYRFHSKI